MISKGIKTTVQIPIDTVIAIHTKLMQEIGGMDGIRDENLLDMSVNSPYKTFGGVDLYPTLIDKAAHLTFSIIKNHPFLDGNKRIGVTLMGIFLKANGIELKCTNEELAALGWGLADGSVTETELVDWINSHI